VPEKSGIRPQSCGRFNLDWGLAQPGEGNLEEVFMSDGIIRKKFAVSTRALHWLSAIIIIGVIAGGLVHDQLSKETRAVVMAMHFSFGLIVLALAVLRILNRLATVTPPPIPGQAAILVLASKLMVLAFYLLLLAMPVIGWAGVNLKGRAVRFFGTELPQLAAENKALGEQVLAAHSVLGFVLTGLVVLHILAGVYHSMRRDGVMERVL
jgi:cytochrome b561